MCVIFTHEDPSELEMLLRLPVFGWLGVTSWDRWTEMVLLGELRFLDPPSGKENS